MYQKIQANQTSIGKHSQQLIETFKSNGTAICLPSSVAHTARKYFSSVQVVHNIAPIFGQDIVTEETVRLNKMDLVVPKFNLEQILKETQANYYLVLVNKGMHWIAIKKEKDQSYSGYDPGTGTDEPVLINGNQIRGTKNLYECSSLVIVIR